MVDVQIVCCMCGDVGFPDKLFRCNKCRSRFQHSYCSNYYGEVHPIEQCDWCQSEERSSRSSRHIQSSSKSKSTALGLEMNTKSEYSGGEKIIMKHDRDALAGGATESKGKSPNGTPSPRPTTRRYKLLKDVMC